MAQQQKMLLAVCVAAGLVALVSGQRLDVLKCTEGIRGQIDTYTQSIGKSLQSFTQQINAQGTDAIDTSRYQKDVEKLVQLLSSLTNMEQGLDGGRIMNTYFEIARTQYSLFTSALRLSVLTGAYDSYADLTSAVLKANSEFFRAATNSCLPTTRRLPAN